MYTFIGHDKEKHWTIALKIAGVSLRQFENWPKMTFSNFTLRRHEDIDHRMFYNLKNVRHMCRSSLNRFPCVNAVPCVIVVDVNVKLDMWIANVWVTALKGKFQGSLPLYNPWLSHSCVSRSVGKLNWNLALLTSNFGLWFMALWWCCVTKFEIPSKHDTLSKLYW